MDFEGIMLGGISQTEEGNYHMISPVCEIWKNKTKMSSLIQVTRGRGWGMSDINKGGQKVQTYSYKINKSSGSNVQHGGYSK